MNLPSWFREAIQGRLDDVAARIQHHPELKRIRAEESKAFQVLFAGMDVQHMPGFAEWEDRHHYSQAAMNERLYLQGMEDGIQLAVALLSHSDLFDDTTSVKSEHNEPGT
ncbi:hypothetical protein [Cohnella silvisoli]|uniref:Uncharacterized protein n=1 Tax=Cohnella silvisoli TaxID=2873699 RepID=A0ABV1KVU8_9BACL|nr:hypothetical protein [Cohnella silvisoli]MCD9023499.1 hypothetical protein [Cohnella silvisoli]